jgi:hypothetical protein
MADRAIYHKASAATCGSGSQYCSGIATEHSSPSDRLCTDLGIGGTGNYTLSLDGQTQGRSLYHDCTLSTGYEPTSGTWTIRLEVEAGVNKTYITAIYICRVNSSCTNQETLGSWTGSVETEDPQTYAQGITCSAPSSWSADDRIVVVFEFHNENHTDASLTIGYDASHTFQVTQEVTGSSTAAGAGGSSANGVAEKILLGSASAAGAAGSVASGVLDVACSSSAAGLGGSSSDGLIDVIGSASSGGVGSSSASGVLDVVGSSTAGGVGGSFADGIAESAVTGSSTSAGAGGSSASSTTYWQVYVSESSYIASSGENTTAQLDAPSGKTTGDFQAGRIQDDENPADAIDLSSGKYTELEWSLQVAEGAPESTIYEFRITDAGTPIDTYTLTPEITVESVAKGSSTAAGAGGSSANGVLEVSASTKSAGAGGSTADANIDVTVSSTAAGAGGSSGNAVIDVATSAVAAGAGGSSSAGVLDVTASSTAAGAGGSSASSVRDVISSAIAAGVGNVAKAAAVLIVIASSVAAGAGGASADGIIAGQAVGSSTAPGIGGSSAQAVTDVSASSTAAGSGSSQADAVTDVVSSATAPGAGGSSANGSIDVGVTGTSTAPGAGGSSASAVIDVTTSSTAPGVGGSSADGIIAGIASGSSTAGGVGNSSAAAVIAHLKV